MRRNPQFKTLTITEAEKMFESSFNTVRVRTVRTVSGSRFIPSFEKSPHTSQFGGYVDTETSKKFESYCAALVRVGFMNSSEVKL